MDQNFNMYKIILGLLSSGFFDFFLRDILYRYIISPDSLWFSLLGLLSKQVPTDEKIVVDRENFFPQGRTSGPYSLSLRRSSR